MLHYDETHKQLLTPLCRQCPDEYFTPKEPSLPHVGCCSYSPVFTLFEVYNMLREDQAQFFLDEIYHNEARTIHPYQIVIHAQLHPVFHKLDSSSLSTLELEDEKIRHSVCQFFIEGTGCGLPPQFKTSICRSFICSTVEDQLDTAKQHELLKWGQDIRREAAEFNRVHQRNLEGKGWDLITHLPLVLEYLSELNN